MRPADPDEELPATEDEGAEPSGIDPEELEGDDDPGEDEEGGSDDPEEAEEEVEEVVYADLPVPSLDQLRSALDWAFDGVLVPDGFLDRCAEHARLVQERNRVMNLTKIVDPKEIAAKHYLDSWRTVEVLPLLGKSVLDIGTGAGYPGIPIALAEEHARVHMMDSTRKKADFVAEAIAKMEIPNASAEWGRAEEHLFRNRYDVCVMRAVSSVRENVRLLRKVRHSLYDLVMMKGSSWSREVRAGEREAERLGFKLDTVWEHELPGDMGGRAILVYRAPGGPGR